MTCDGENEINTPTCSDSAACTPTINTTTCSCGCSPCQCGRAQTAAPTPYYNAAGSVEETHCKTIVQQTLVAAIVTSSSFNVPACQGTVVIVVPGLNKIQLGSYLWNPTYGYFEVVAFDYVSQQITVKNTCTQNCVGNEPAFAVPGTLVPACTMFNVVDPPCIQGFGGPLSPYLAVDFVAPDVGNCINISVTTTIGLFVGEIVYISVGKYRISAIVDTTTITICNDGDGAAHGTIIIAKDGNGDYVVPIAPTSASACENPPVTQGSIIVCHAGIQQPLEGQFAGQVPVLINAATGEAQYQSIDLSASVCTTVTSCINLLIGTTVYVIEVADSGIFQLNDILIIHDALTETYRWTVTNIIDPTHIEITKTTPQTANETVGCDDNPICLAPCCEQLAAGTDICNYDWSGAFLATKNNDVGTVATAVLPGNVVSHFDTAQEAVIIENPTCNIASIFCTLKSYAYGYIMNSTPATPLPDRQVHASYIMNAGYDIVAIAGAFPAPTYSIQKTMFNSYFLASNSVNYQCMAYEDFDKTLVISLAAGFKIKIYLYTEVTYYGEGTAAIEYTANAISSLDAIAVAVQAAP